VILNGVPRSGKSSVARAIQDLEPGDWVNIGVDSEIALLPDELKPGIGLRPNLVPGQVERPDLEPLIPEMYLSMYRKVVESGRKVVVDVGHHDGLSLRQNSLILCARLLVESRIPAWIFGIACPVDVVRSRRERTGMVASDEMLIRWEVEVHRPGIYDARFDSSVLSSDEIALEIMGCLRSTPSAVKRISELELADIL
jgi:chloramphenicol 3-O phosphotransferase